MEKTLNTGKFLKPAKDADIEAIKQRLDALEKKLAELEASQARPDEIAKRIAEGLSASLSALNERF